MVSNRLMADVNALVIKVASLVGLLLVAQWAGAQSADVQEYTSGHTALQVWDSKAQENLPPAVDIWLKVMMVTFLSGLLFVWKHVIARWVFGGVISSMLVGALIAKLFGVVPLSGYVALMHLIFWSPGLFLLLKRRPFMGPLSAFSVWSGIATLVVCISFVFDIRDAAIYLHHLFS